jgi:RND family efflux transporter MFP subunit
VKEGQRVNKGQVLAQIDAATISSSIQEIKTALEFAEYNLQKQQELAAQGLGTEFQLQQAKSNVNNLKSQLNSLKTQRGKFVITAPFSGIVDQVYARVGAMAGPQSQVLRLFDNSDLKIIADVSERLYARLSLGMPVAVQVPSLNDTVVALSISQIGNYIHPTNRTFRVQASLKNNKLLLPNMLTRMRITDYINNEALLVSSESVLIDNMGEHYVYIAEKTQSKGYVAKRINVKVKESFDGLSEIEQRPGGLERGMLVVARGVRGISESDLLKLMD